MKSFGLVLIAFGFALLVFVAYSVIQEKNRALSPIPENKGVRVIFVSPSK